MKTPVILRIFKKSQLVEVKQFDSDQIIIGHEADVQVDLDDESVSPIHCLIELRDSGYYLCDLGSQSGTFKNGKQVLDEPLSSGDAITIGAFSLQFFVGVPKPKAPPALKVAPEVVSEVVADPVPVVPAAPPNSEPPKSTPPPPRAKSGSGNSGKIVVPPVATPQAPKLPDQPMRSKSGTDGLYGGRIKGEKTFAPPSEISNLSEYLKPTKGTTIEVVVAWKERVLETYHFSGKQKTVKSGPSSKYDIFIPSNFQSSPMPFLNVAAGTVQVFANDGVSIEIVTSQERLSLDDLLRSGKALRSGAGHSVRLDQGDLICLSFANGTLQIFVRYVPASPIPIVASLLDLTGSELTGMIVALVVVSLIALYMSIYTPPPNDDMKPDEQVHLAKFVYNQSTPTPTPKPEPVKPPPPPVVQATPTPTPKPQPTPEPKKVTAADKEREQKKSGKTESNKAAQKPATLAAEVRPNPTKLDRPKKFTSVKQGGAVKIGNTAGANAQSAKDVTKTGLLSAFGTGGNRKALDQAYSGSGELLGMADKATGTSGQNENRAGDDIGSKIKDSGAGGKGTATQGIAGVGTKGRSGGNSAYGGIGYGGKGNVSIDAGGSEEAWEGKIDKEAVRRVIRSILSQIKSCYERQLRTKTGLEGKVVIRFKIEEQGRVREAGTKSTSLNDSEVESCVAARIREQRFPEPPPGSYAEVDYPFVFGAQK